MSEQPISEERLCLWTRAEIHIPSRSGEYRIRNHNCEEGRGHFIHPEDDGLGGWTVSANWPGGEIADWTELDS